MDVYHIKNIVVFLLKEVFMVPYNDKYVKYVINKINDYDVDYNNQDKLKKVISTILNNYFDERVLNIIKKVLLNNFTMPYNDSYYNYIIDALNNSDKTLSNTELEKKIFELFNNYFKERKKNIDPNINKYSNDELINIMRDGNINARDIILEKNYPLIKYYVSKYSGLGVETNDLMQEASLSFLKGLARYNPEYGFAFSTYMSYWIKQGILRAIDNNNRVIRVPVYIQEEIRKFTKLFNNLYFEEGIIPNIEDVSLMLGYSKEKTDIIIDSQTKISSLNALVGEDEAELIDFISSDELTPENIIANDFNEQIEYLIENSGLSDIEKKVIRMRFGFVDDKIYTLREIGNIVGFTKQNIHLMEQKILQKLRVNEFTESLACYTDNEDSSLLYLKRVRSMKHVKSTKNNN